MSQKSGFYPPPQKGNVVIEPFAGSATYSTYHEPEVAVLVDKDPVIVGIWHYLINASEQQIASLPTFGDKDGYDYGDFDKVMADLEPAERDLIGFWIAKGIVRPTKSLGVWFMKHHQDNCCLVWNAHVKDRIMTQLSKIRNWQVILGNYDSFDKQHLSPLSQQSIKTESVNAFKNQTYFIDPPYSGFSGRHYKYNKINYQNLKIWIDKLVKDKHRNQIIACENQDLRYRWANFNQTAEAFNMHGKKTELAYINE